MKIKDYLDTPCPVFEFDTIDSTNNEAKRMLEKDSCSCPFVIVANGQTAGRGRQGKNFYSPQNTGIYMTVVFEIESNTDITFFTSAAAVAVAEAIENSSNITTEIKWVNDIYSGGKKVSGILCEAVCVKNDDKSGKFIVVGVGVNISTKSFPHDIENSAASVGNLLYEKNKLIAEIADNILYVAENPNVDFIFEKYRQKSCVIGKNIKYLQNNVWHTGYAENINRDGSLEVITEDGKKVTLSGGEITLRFEQ